MLHRRAVERRRRFGASSASRAVAVVAEHAHLDELVRGERDVDLVQHRRRQAVLADGDDRVQSVRLGAQRAALGGREQSSWRKCNRERLLELCHAPCHSTPPEEAQFGKAWMHEHVNDHYVQEAKRLGYRSRAAFKLIELAEKDQLLRPG